MDDNEFVIQVVSLTSKPAVMGSQEIVVLTNLGNLWRGVIKRPNHKDGAPDVTWEKLTPPTSCHHPAQTRQVQAPTWVKRPLNPPGSVWDEDDHK